MEAKDSYTQQEMINHFEELGKEYAIVDRVLCFSDGTPVPLDSPVLILPNREEKIECIKRLLAKAKIAYEQSADAYRPPELRDNYAKALVELCEELLARGYVKTWDFHRSLVRRTHVRPLEFGHACAKIVEGLA